MKVNYKDDIMNGTMCLINFYNQNRLDKNLPLCFVLNILSVSFPEAYEQCILRLEQDWPDMFEISTEEEKCVS